MSSTGVFHLSRLPSPADDGPDSYARTLSFDDLPDYEGLRELFRGLATRMGIEYDGVYDWTVPSTPRSSKSDDLSAETEVTGGRFCEACRKRRLENASGGSENSKTTTHRHGWR